MHACISSNMEAYFLFVCMHVCMYVSFYLNTQDQFIKYCIRLHYISFALIFLLFHYSFWQSAFSHFLDSAGKSGSILSEVLSKTQREKNITIVFTVITLGWVNGRRSLMYVISSLWTGEYGSRSKKQRVVTSNVIFMKII